MSSTKHISIKEASRITGKSIQTIRRMIKSKKVKFKKDKTPQGFNYLIDKESLIEFFKDEKGLDFQTNIPAKGEATEKATEAEAETIAALNATAVEEEEAVVEPIEAEQSEETDIVVQQDRQHQDIANYDHVKEFTGTMQKLIDQHSKEKENLFKLIESFQSKVISLENKMKTESGSSKKWFKLW